MTLEPRAMFAESIFLTGPTASGKTALASELAPRLDAEILSLDSMAVYRGMEIGVAKPSAAERAAAMYHLLDLVEPSQEFSVAEYLAAAERCVADIQQRGRRALFVGGTPLYLKALLRGLFAGPPANWEQRHELAQFAAAHGDRALHARLAAVDPVAAKKLHPNDTRRIIRALEVFDATGSPISRWQQQFDHARPASASAVFLLEWPRPELVRRIDQRVEAMFAAGLVDEVRGLLERGASFGRTASQAVGYRETLEFLRGERDLRATIELVKIRTRQFAKRQLTWFRSLSECRPVPLEPGVDLRQIASSIVGQIPVR